MSEPTVPPGPPPASPPPPPPPVAPGGGGGTVSPNRGVMIVLSYLGLLALIPLLVEKDDKEVQWHAKHGLVLMVAEFVVLIAVWILSFIITLATAGLDLGCSGCILVWLFIIAVGVLQIMCIVKGVNGQRMIVPGISQYADRF